MRRRIAQARGGAYLAALCLGLALGMSFGPLGAASKAAVHQDDRAVGHCHSLPPTVSLKGVTGAETEQVCGEMARVPGERLFQRLR